MNCKNYFGYQVYDDGTVKNSKGIVLKPQRNKNWYYYELSILGKTKRIGAGEIVLFSNEFFPLKFNQNIKHIDGNPSNNSLHNLKW